MVRFEAIQADESFPGEVFRRLTEHTAEGGRYEELRNIAKSCGLPKGRFVQWFTTKHSELYEAALKVRAADFAIDAMNAALEATPETVPVAKLKADVALKLASRFDRERFGERSATVPVAAAAADAGLVRACSELLQLAMRNERVSERVVLEQPREPIDADAI